MFCLFCGKEFEQKKTRGRPREFCSSECQICHKYYREFESRVSLIQFTEDKLKQIKGDLFALVSSINTNFLRG